MERSPSSEANSRKISKETLPFMEPKVSLPCSQDPATGPYPEQGHNWDIKLCCVISWGLRQYISSPMNVKFLFCDLQELQ
jgi:hypothetical protein